MPDLAGRGPLGLKPAKPFKAHGKTHMARVAQLPCVICQARPVTVHHCISGRYGQRKASDMDTIPLCHNHHQGAEGIHTSKRAWEAQHGPDTGYLPIVAAMLARLP
jgi:hypothetical protein